MKRKTLDDLIMFCRDKQIYSFNSKEAGYKLCVMVPASFEKDDEEDSSMLYCTVRAFHTGTNRNHSSVSESAAKKAMKTMAYKPILANFTTDADGNPDFTSHDMDIDNNGNTVYIERQIGCFTADVPYFEQDPDHEDRKYVMAKAAIPREYTAAADIIERKNGTKVSIELLVNEMQYDAQSRVLMLEDVEVSGLTCLGVDPETKESINEGMEGARMDITDFSVENNSVCYVLSDDIKKFIQDSIQEALDNIKNLKKGGSKQMDNFEENVEVTEELEKEVEQTAESEEVTETESNEETVVTEAEAEETVDETPSEDDNFAVLSVDFNGEKKEFSISLRDKMNALYSLVNETYGDVDNDYYDVDVYEEDKTVVMHGWCSGKHYRQQYGVKKDIYSLKGDRTECFVQFLTADEISQLDAMKQNYSAMEEKLAKYESEPEKITILESDDYSQIKETEQYAALLKDHFDIDKEDLAKKLDDILLDYAKKNKVEFSTESEKKPVETKKLPVNKSGKSGRYGSLFNKN